MSRRTILLETTTEMPIKHFESSLKRAADDAVKKLLSRPKITETDGSVWIDVTDLVNEKAAAS
jgi:hypothetical protein